MLTNNHQLSIQLLSMTCLVLQNFNFKTLNMLWIKQMHKVDLIRWVHIKTNYINFKISLKMKIQIANFTFLSSKMFYSTFSLGHYYQFNWKLAAEQQSWKASANPLTVWFTTSDTLHCFEYYNIFLIELVVHSKQ